MFLGTKVYAFSYIFLRTLTFCLNKLAALSNWQSRIGNESWQSVIGSTSILGQILQGGHSNKFRLTFVPELLDVYVSARPVFSGRPVLASGNMVI